VDALAPIHSVWNCRLRHNGSGRVADCPVEGVAVRPGGVAVPLGGVAVRPGGVAVPLGGVAVRPGGVAVPLGGVAVRPGGVAVPLGGSAAPPGSAAVVVFGLLIMASSSLRDSHVIVIIHVNMNDGMIVRIWQDESMEQPLPEVEPPSVRNVADVDVLKAMADPTRLAILAALMKTPHDLPVMSVKELAAELGQPQTKLYRHVRQLEAVGLIKVASTRMVSGILEQRYQACQQDLMFERGFLAEHADESEAATQTALDRYREGLFEALRTGRLPEGDLPAEESYRKPLLFMSDLRVSRAKAAELKRKLEEVIDSLKDESGDDSDGVPVNLLIGCYVPADPHA